MYLLKILRGALAALLLLSLVTTTARANDNLSAFTAFVRAADYQNANFYLANGFVAAADVDSGQMFYTILMDRYAEQLSDSLPAVEQLYTYLSGLGAIDLNRRFACGDNSECLLVNRLAQGYRTSTIAWFVSRGLDLNRRELDIVPATLPMVTRLGSVYNMNDLNWFVGNGMVLGDETYSIEELLAYRDSAIRNTRYDNELIVPENFLNLGNQNFLDVLVISLGSNIRDDGRAMSRRRDMLCSFITYAAGAYTPSFDYLRYLLQTVDEFRGNNIGSQTTGGGGVYAPFPTSCVLLVKAMATSHAQLEQITSEFANQGDVATASWLLSILQGRS